MKAPGSKLIAGLVKFLIAAVIILFLSRAGLIDFRSLDVILSQPVKVIVALFLLFLGIVISGYRWALLLRVSGHQFSLSTVMRLQLIGSFFSAYLPGAAGGDLAKGVYLFRMLERNGGRSTAMFTVLIDRAFSLVGLVSIALFLSLYLYFGTPYDTAIHSYVQLTIVVSLALPVMIAIGVFFAKNRERFRMYHHLPDWIERYVKVISILVTDYSDKWNILLCCWFISMIASGTVVLGIAIIASLFSYGPSAVVASISGVFGNLSSAVPITPGGIGIGEAVFSHVCSLLTKQVAPFATIYLTFRLGMYVANLPGGILTLMFTVVPPNGPQSKSTV